MRAYKMIESAQHTEQGPIVAVIDGETLIIPDDMNNRHRVMIEEWQAAGNVIQPWKEPTAPTPEERRAVMRHLTPREFRDILIDNDIMPDHVAAKINEISDPKVRAKAFNAWEYPTEFIRVDPLIDQIGVMFGLSPEQIDMLWLG